MSYDGSLKWERIEAGLRRQGLILEFSCMYNDHVPEDVGYTGRETGWEMRRKLTAWCAKHGIKEFVILRNTSYHPDLHGVVYQLWVRPTPKAADAAQDLHT